MVVAALGTVLAAAYLLWLYQRVAFGTPTEEFAHDPHVHDVSLHRVRRLGADAGPDRGARLLPEHHLPRHQPGRDQHVRPSPGPGADPLLAHLVTFAWDAPSVDLHALAPEIVVAATLVILLVVDAFTGRRPAVGGLVASPASACSSPSSRCATLAYDGVARSCSAAATSSTTTRCVLKALFLLVGLRRGAARRRTTSPRATTGRASTTR